MSGKFEKKTPKAGPRRKKLVPALIATALILLAVLAILLLVSGKQPPAPEATTQPTAGETETIPATTAPVFQPIDLGQGLIITDIGSYTGAYVEDGSDEVVSGVLMAILENTSEEALQYARISLMFGQTEAQFAVTNLPAGEKVVLLEQNRLDCPETVPDSFSTADMLFLPSFEMYEDMFAITGEKGLLTIENLSGTDISGDIYVYYKNSAQDLYYGGITYRAKLSGLKAGEQGIAQATHYNPTGSTILMVSYVP